MQISNENVLNNFKKKGEKLNIAIFSDCYYPLVGGITLRVFNQALELSKYANVIVVTGAVGKYEDDPNLPFCVIRCKGMKASEYQGNLAFPALDHKFKKLIKSLKIDVIHLHTYFAMAKSAHYFRKKMGIPIIQVSHQRLYPEYLNVVKSRLIAKILTKYSINMIYKADALWTVSQNVLNFYRESGISRDIVIDPSGTDREYPENDKELIEMVAKKYDIKPDEKVFVALSRMEMKQKNLDFLLNGIELAKQKGLKNFKLFMVGKGKDLEKLKSIAKSKKLNEVCFTGFVSNQEATGLYLRSDVHLFPSVCDNFGLTKVEAASLGTPTLALKDTAVAESIIDGYNGFVAERNVEDFAEKIIDCVADEQRLKKVSLAAKETMGKTWKDLAPTTLENTINFLKSINKYNA